MDKVIGVLAFVWVVLSSTTTIMHWGMKGLTSTKFTEAASLCGDRELKYIDIGVFSHTVVCKDGGEYCLS